MGCRGTKPGPAAVFFRGRPPSCRCCCSLPLFPPAALSHRELLARFADPLLYAARKRHDAAALGVGDRAIGRGHGPLWSSRDVRALVALRVLDSRRDGVRSHRTTDSAWTAALASASGMVRAVRCALRDRTAEESLDGRTRATAASPHFRRGPAIDRRQAP